MQVQITAELLIFTTILLGWLASSVWLIRGIRDDVKGMRTEFKQFREDMKEDKTETGIRLDAHEKDIKVLQTDVAILKSKDEDK